MKRIWLLAAALALVAPAMGAAQDSAALFSVKNLSPQTALAAAQAALEACRGEGYQVAVSVVDRSGVAQILLRDRFAGPHTPDAAYRKAWTAASFRTDSLELGKLTETGEAWAIRGITNALPLGGGVMIRAGDGSMVGAIGVSGAPSGALDEGCARKGLQAIEEAIAF